MREFLLQLLPNHQIHRRKQPFLRTSNKIIRSSCQARRRPCTPTRRQPHHFHDRQKSLNHPPHRFRHSQDSKKVPHRTHIPKISSNRKIPRYEIRTKSHVLRMLQLKPCCLNSSMSFIHFHHICYPISLLNAESDFSVTGIAWVVLGGHEPFVDPEYSARF